MSQKERQQKAMLRQLEERARLVQEQRKLSLRSIASVVRRSLAQHWRWPA